VKMRISFFSKKLVQCNSQTLEMHEFINFNIINVFQSSNKLNQI